jgi:dipeptidyl aminopeptidase/acylaminoacyl peptidase
VRDACILMTLLALAVRLAAASAAPAPSRNFEVRDSIEMSRFGANNDSQPDDLDDDGIASPDGGLIIKLTHRGVLPSGVTEGTIWLFDAKTIKRGLDHSNVAIPPPTILARMSATVNGLEFIAERNNTISRPTWIDGGRALAFLGRDGRENRQLFRVDVASRQIEALTPASQNVIDYVWSHGVFTYLAGANENDANRWETVGTDLPDNVDGIGNSLKGLLFPHWWDTYHETVDLQLWQVRGGSAAPVVAAETKNPLILTTRYVMETMALSPDGTHLVTIASDGSPLPALTDISPLDVAVGLQYRLIDLASGTNEALLPASMMNSQYNRYRAAWSPGGDTIAITETSLDPGDAGRSTQHQSCDVAIVRMSDRQAQCVQSPPDKTHGFLYSFIWQSGIELRLRYRLLRATRVYMDRPIQWSKGSWIVQDTWKLPVDCPLSLAVDEALNKPPVLVAIDPASGHRREIFDPNPQFSRLKLGEVRDFEWHDEHGRSIVGGLVFPAEYDKGQRYPLVIQTHGYHPREFFVTGGSDTSHAGRAIAARGIIVLQAGGAWEPYWHTRDESRENGTNVYLAAIKELTAEGLINPARVGISGYSATGRQVSDAITFAPDRFASAVIANADPVSLFDYFAFVDTPLRPLAQIVDAGPKPYGDGLPAWLERAPGFNTDKIKAPVLIFAADPEHLIHLWSLYASLRDQGKPVDLHYIRSGAHNIMKPLQILSHQEMMVDWFDFWLNGHEDAVISKAEQYSRWRLLRSQMQRTGINNEP